MSAATMAVAVAAATAAARGPGTAAVTHGQAGLADPETVGGAHPPGRASAHTNDDDAIREPRQRGQNQRMQQGSLESFAGVSFMSMIMSSMEPFLS